MQPNGDCILFDPQFNTKEGGVARWDLGPIAIQEFVKSHMCSKYCRYLELAPLIPVTPKPVALAPNRNIDEEAADAAADAAKHDDVDVQGGEQDPTSVPLATA
jgi:hypothetical protein